MKITIKCSDWKSGVVYCDPCGCLLARAIKRQLNIRKVHVVPGEVEIGNEETYVYDDRRFEDRIEDAHTDRSLLPLTITLKEYDLK